MIRKGVSPEARIFRRFRVPGLPMEEKNIMLKRDYDMPEVIVGIHEPRKLYTKLETKVDVKFEHLKVGDVVSGQICIERKAQPDFFGSLYSKRIFKQIHDMLDNFNLPYLILEGGETKSSIFSGKPGIQLNALFGFLAKYSRKLPILQIEREFYSDLLFKIISQKESKSERPVVKRRNRTREEISEDILCSLPKIGRHQAKKILSHFGSVENFILSDKKEISGVKKLNEFRAHFKRFEYFNGRIKILKPLLNFVYLHICEVSQITKKLAR